jgi:hypothetical protein
MANLITPLPRASHACGRARLISSHSASLVSIEGPANHVISPGSPPRADEDHSRIMIKKRLSLKPCCDDDQESEEPYGTEPQVTGAPRHTEPLGRAVGWSCSTSVYDSVPGFPEPALGKRIAYGKLHV